MVTQHYFVNKHHKMNDCYFFLGISNNRVYHVPTGYINDTSQRRGGTWHIALTDINVEGYK